MYLHTIMLTNQVSANTILSSANHNYFELYSDILYISLAVIRKAPTP